MTDYLGRSKARCEIILEASETFQLIRQMFGPAVRPCAAPRLAQHRVSAAQQYTFRTLYWPSSIASRTISPEATLPRGD